MPKRPCPTHKPLRILLGHLAPSTGVEAGDVLPVRHHLRALHLHRRQRQPYEELPNVYWQRRTFQVFSCPTIFYDFFSALTFRISMPPLARLGLSSRDHFGARSEQCTTWPPGTCSSQSRSSIGPSSSLEEGRSWCQVIIENGHCIVCYLYATSHQIKKASLRRRENEEKKATTSPHRSHSLLGSLRWSTKQITLIITLISFHQVL